VDLGRQFRDDGQMSDTAMTQLSQPAGHEQVLFEGRRALIPNLGVGLLVVLTLGLWLLPAWLRSLSTRYRVTDRRIVIESGLLSKRLEQVDLYRISDYTVDRPFLQRLVGTGNLLLKTIDRTTPEVNLLAIKTDIVALYERVRAATEVDKRRRGVRVLDTE
jgi:uncharacterized membrane protein YdbT with pleckstrin-like domain